MGNQICGGETVRANAKAEADEELTMEKSKATKSKTTPISEEESARMIQSKYKAFDLKIKQTTRRSLMRILLIMGNLLLRKR